MVKYSLQFKQLSMSNPNPLRKVTKQAVIKKSQIHTDDSGSPEVQIAVLTERIANLTEHLKKNHKDKRSTDGLRRMVGRRKRLLRYIGGKDPVRQKKIMAANSLKKK